MTDPTAHSDDTLDELLQLFDIDGAVLPELSNEVLFNEISDTDANAVPGAFLEPFRHVQLFDVNNVQVLPLLDNEQISEELGENAVNEVPEAFLEPFRPAHPLLNANIIQEGGEENPLVEISRGRSRLERFRLDTHSMRYRIAPLPEGVDPIYWTNCAFRRVYDEIVNAGQNGNNRFCFSFGFDGLNDGDAWERPRAIRGYKFEDLWNLVFKISQSGGGFDVLDTFWIKLHIAEAPQGQSCRFDHNKQRGKGLLAIINPNDHLCLPRALVVSLAHCEKQSLQVTTGALHAEWHAIRKHRGRRQVDAAKALTVAANVDIPEGGCGYEEIVKFQEYFANQGTAIIVYTLSAENSGRKDNPVFYDGTGEVRLRLGINTPHRILRVLLYPEEKHFDVIINLRTFQGYSKYCEPCRKGYHRPSSHKCPSKCAQCLQSPACPLERNNDITCKDCNRYFHGPICFENHKKNGSYGFGSKTVCLNYKYCGQCKKMLSEQQYKKHECGRNRCVVCKTDRAESHDCFMPIAKPLVNKKNKCNAFVYYDFETRQEDSMPGTERLNVHVPNLCISQLICERCCNESDEDMDGTGSHRSLQPCCGMREFIFYGEDCVEKFVDYINSIRKGYSKVVCIAHNAKGYDGQFILREIIKRKTSDLNTIITGTSITLLEYTNVKFIDSLNYIAMPLSAMPKSFGLPDIAKGYFPHFFNTAANQSYVGSMPDRKFYSPETMCRDSRALESFDTWYRERVQEGYVFDFKKELIFYCFLDVTILRRACNQFRNLILEKGNVCPFSECVTIASTCMKIFQRNYLTADTIGVVPRNGYRLTNTQSRTAIEWMLWVEHVDNVRITHALRGKEFKASPSLRLDGYRDDNGVKYAYQFHGCYWHGCPRCFKCVRVRPIGKSQLDTFEDRYQKTLHTASEIRRLGYILIEKWECDFNREKKNNAELSKFLECSKVLSIVPLDPRDAFFGGRTGNTVTHYDADGVNEKIRYVDVCSLYPWVSKNGIFPVGHPTLYVGSECEQICPFNNLDNVVGLIKCRVLPPRNLFHPVLPVRAHGKLLFPLCGSCCRDIVKKDCYHEQEKDRELCGTWVSCELQMAVQMGYIIKEISEVWHYEKTEQYNPVTREGGLFTEYINSFLKTKQEASGWPEGCIDESAQNKYISEYKRVEGISLDRVKIEKNPGLRSVAKLCLNSFWGKFGQRENMLKHSVVHTHEEFVHLIFNPDIEVMSLVPVDDDTVFVSWRMLDENYEISNKANVIIAAFTTAQARLKLYGYLKEQGDKVLYYDTDSVIYVSNGVNDLKTGNFLGDLTDEVEEYGPGSYISSFVSGGPKCYAYVVQKPNGETKEVCKFKGVRQNYNTKHLINFNTLRELVVTGKKPFNINYTGIRRTKYHQVVTREEQKIIQVTGPKRRIVNEQGQTLPYGYKRARRE